MKFIGYIDPNKADEMVFVNLQDVKGIKRSADGNSILTFISQVGLGAVYKVA